MKKNFRIISLYISILLLAVSCGKQKIQEPRQGNEFLLGTSCMITLQEWDEKSDPDSILADAFALIDTIERSMSVNLDGSNLSRINQNPAAGIQAEEEVLTVLESALKIAKLSEGRFDPSVGALVSLWGIGSDHAAVPSASELQDVLTGVGYKNIRIEGSSVYLDKKGTQIDLGGIAKGYAADRVRSLLLARGVKRAIINLGGNVLIMGEKSSGDPWKIGIQDPREVRGEYLGILSTEEKAIVTSGIYERFFMEDGVRYHHILDSSTGYPVDNGLISTTIVHKDSLMADGLSTALFSLGIKKGMALAETLEDTGVIMVDEDNMVYISSNLRDSFSLSPGSEYTLFMGNQN